MLIRFIKKTPTINFLNRRKLFFYLSGVFSILSLIFLILKGLNFGIDFKGGLLIEVSFKENVQINYLLVHI